jgi:hypothetical protein
MHFLKLFFQCCRNFLIVSIVIQYREVGVLHIILPFPKLCINSNPDIVEGKHTEYSYAAHDKTVYYS